MTTTTSRWPTNSVSLVLNALQFTLLPLAVQYDEPAARCSTRMYTHNSSVCLQSAIVSLTGPYL